MPDTGPQVAMLGDGRRLHLQHGPIDLLIEVEGSTEDRLAAFAAAEVRFRTVLHELVAELDLLRRPTTGEPVRPEGAVAVRMVAATSALPEAGLTPMAAVAGAVADEIGAELSRGVELTSWSVNNGGDIAIGLSPGRRYRVGLVPDPRRAVAEGRLTIGHDDGIGGVATSGWRGRSWSTGIADAVTVAARTAAAADAAATAIANRVDVGDHPMIERRPADEVDPASDLGDLPVTVDVGPLRSSDLAGALERGNAYASDLAARRVIAGASCSAGGRTVTTWRRTLDPGSELLALRSGVGPSSGGRYSTTTTTSPPPTD